MEGRMGRHHGGVERQETAEQRAARLVTEELKRRKKGDPKIGSSNHGITRNYMETKLLHPASRSPVW
jgi:hypothetical protein